MSDTIYTVKLEGCEKHFEELFHEWYDIAKVCDIKQYFTSKYDAQNFADALNDLAWQLWQDSNWDASIDPAVMNDARDISPCFVVTLWD